MSVNPLGELDMELDEIVDHEVCARWTTYCWWALGWSLAFVVWLMAGIVTVVLILADEPFGVGVAVLVALTVGLVVMSIFGYRAREHWRRAWSLRIGQ